MGAIAEGLERRQVAAYLVALAIGALIGLLAPGPASGFEHLSYPVLGVLRVLLTPCIDYVIVFTRLAGGSDRRLLAAAPLLMLAQLALLPPLGEAIIARAGWPGYVAAQDPNPGHPPRPAIAFART